MNSFTKLKKLKIAAGDHTTIKFFILRYFLSMVHVSGGARALEIPSHIHKNTAQHLHITKKKLDQFRACVTQRY